MTLSPGSKSFGTRIAAAGLSAAVFFSGSTAAAQQPEATAPFDNSVLQLLLESRTQKPASQATEQERASAIDELTNIYLVSNLPRAVELGKSPQISAQLDL